VGQIGPTPISINANNGYRGSIDLSVNNEALYVLSGVAPAQGQYAHITLTGITGGSAAMSVYTDVVGENCADGYCESGSSCAVTLTCAYPVRAVYVIVTGSQVTCQLPLSFTLTSVVSGFPAPPSTPTQYTIANNDTLMFGALNVPTSLVFSVDMVQGPPVTLAVYEDTCLQMEWRMQSCVYGSPCRIVIPTPASHPQNTNWYITISSTGGSTFMFNVNQGNANCKVPQFGPNDFCGNGVVTYSAWNYMNATQRNLEAQARFNTLEMHFTCSKTEECYAALQRFTCYEAFKACDPMGFYVGLCRSACDDVAAACGSFCEYQLPFLACSSDRYLDNEPCTGTGPHVTTTGPTTSAVSTTTLNPTSGTGTGTTTGHVSSAPITLLSFYSILFFVCVCTLLC